MTNVTSVTPTPAKPSGGERPFPRSSRILRSADFRHVYDHGFRVSGPLFAAFCEARKAAREDQSRQDQSRQDQSRQDEARPDSGDGSRIGLTVPRKLGGAVIRNRIKRRLREAFRLHRSKLAANWDIVFNPRPAIRDATFTDIQRELGKVIERCNSR